MIKQYTIYRCFGFKITMDLVYLFLVFLNGLIMQENIEFKQFKREAEMARLNSAVSYSTEM